MFGEAVDPMFACVRTGMDGTRKLSQLRNYLLPKLLDGAVRVKEAKRVLETTL